MFLSSSCILLAMMSRLLRAFSVSCILLLVNRSARHPASIVRPPVLRDHEDEVV